MPVVEQKKKKNKGRPATLCCPSRRKMPADAWAVTRICVELDRLLPKCEDASLDAKRRYVFTCYAAEKLQELEEAGRGSDEVAKRVADFEEQLMALVAKAKKKPTVTAPSRRTSSKAPPRPVAATSKDDALKTELEHMTASLKTSSLEMHSKLTGQHGLLDKIDDATLSNDNAVNKGRTDVRDLANRTARHFFNSMGSLFAVGLTFAFTYLFIRLFPK